MVVRPTHILQEGAIIPQTKQNKMAYTAKDPCPPPMAFSVPKRNVLYLRETKLGRCERRRKRRGGEGRRRRGGENVHLKTQAPLGGRVGKKTDYSYPKMPMAFSHWSNKFGNLANSQLVYFSKTKSYYQCSGAIFLKPKYRWRHRCSLSWKWKYSRIFKFIFKFS